MLTTKQKQSKQNKTKTKPNKQKTTPNKFNLNSIEFFSPHGLQPFIIQRRKMIYITLNVTIA